MESENSMTSLKNGKMNIAPDRKPNKMQMIRDNYMSEPADWFSRDFKEEAGIEYTIKNIIVLTTLDSPRYEEFLELNSKHAMEFTPFYGTSGTKPEVHIFNNYLTILNNWFKENTSSEVVAISEDDVLFLSGAFDFLSSAMKQLPSNWDTLSGNFSAIPKIKLISPNLISPVSYASSMNFSVFHRRSLIKIKDKLELRKGGSTIHKHIDRYCFSPEVGLNSYCTWPMLCREVAGYSMKDSRLTNTFENLIESKPYRFWFLDKNRWTP